MCVAGYFFFFKQKTAYEMRISDWSSDVCSSDLASGGSITMVAGDEHLAKVTYVEDFRPTSSAIRIGQGFDVHRLAKGEELWLCGIKIAHEFGLSGDRQSVV